MPQPVHTCYADEDSPLPFFAKRFEVCEIVLGFFKKDDNGRYNPTLTEHHDAWQHVKCCFTCLRNCSRMLFEYCDGHMPLPVFIKRGESPAFGIDPETLKPFVAGKAN